MRASISRHVPLNDEQWNIICGHITERYFKKGDYLTQDGEVNRYTNFIVKGCTRVFHIDHTGQEHVVQLCIMGWWTGDYPSFITQTKGMLYTEALEPTSILAFSHDHIHRLFDEVPAFERFYRILIQNAYANFQYRVLSNIGMDAEQRYIAFKERYPDIDAQVSQKHIASYLGISAEFLSKIKRRIYERNRARNRSNSVSR